MEDKNNVKCLLCAHFKDYYCKLHKKFLTCLTACRDFADFVENPNEDNINHPSHYETGRFECIDVMIETQGAEAVKAFCVCNAFKYLYRHSYKNGDEDIKKAIWYLNKYLELSETKE